jgi:ribosomal protein L34E
MDPGKYVGRSAEQVEEFMPGRSSVLAGGRQSRPATCACCGQTRINGAAKYRPVFCQRAHL